MTETTINFTVKEILEGVDGKIDKISETLIAHIKDGDVKMEEIKEHVIRTNGKVKTAKIIGMGAVALAMTVAGWLVMHLININN